MRMAAGAVLLLGLTFTVAGCTTGTTPQPTATTQRPVPTTTLVVPGTIHVTGDVVLSNASGTAVYADAWGCFGQNDFADVVQAAQIVVTDQVGRVVAVGSLGPGRPTFGPDEVPTQCTFDLHVDNVPDSATGYTVSLGERGDTTYTLAQLRAGIHLRLG